MGSEARTRIGLAALLLAALFCFELVFATGDYAGPALLGAALSMGLAVVCRRVGIGALFTLLFSTSALIVYIVILFQADKTAWGLPTPGAFEALGRAVSNAGRASVVDFAPVPVRTGYVIMVVVGMWITATVAEIATFRWRNPLIASVGPIALVAVTLVVGTGRADVAYLAIFLTALFVYWSLESAHRLRSWGRWVGAFRTQRTEDPPSVTGSLARRMGATCLAATLVAPIFLPALGDGLLDWKGGSGSGQGSGEGGEIDLLVDITPRLLEQSETQLFSVTAAEGTYWRLASLVDFDGERWHPLDEDRESTERSIPYVDAPPEGKELLQTYNIDGLGGTYLPAATTPVEVEGVTVDAGVETGSLQLDDGELGDGNSYTVRSETSTATYEDLIDAEPGDLADLDGDTAYFNTPVLSPAVKELRRGWTAGKGTAFQQLIAIQKNLRRRFEYSTDTAADANTSVDYLEQFLLDTRRGFCQQFATAFAVLARDAGYPTRVSVGFLPGSASNQEDGNFLYTVTGTEAHAWPEVYFDDYGWVAFEPTPREDGLATEPSYTQPLPEGGDAGGGDTTTEENGPGPQNENVRDLARGGNPRLNSRLRDTIDFINNLELPGPNEDAPWRAAFGRIVLGLVIAAVAWLMGVPAAKQLRITRRYRQASSATDTVMAAFSQFETDAAQFGTIRLASESPRAFVARLASTDAVDGQGAKKLAGLAERAEYSSEGSRPEHAAESVRLARSLRGSLWSRASLLRRAAALWSLKGLLAIRSPRVRRRYVPVPATGAN